MTALIRCMGGKFCDHAPGTCTATQGMQAFPNSEPEGLKAESVNGWTPPVMYDLANDETRIVTQADVNRLLGIQKCYFDLLQSLRGSLEREENRIKEA